MSQPRRTTFGRYNLLLEVSVLVLTSAILCLAVWFTLAEINQKYLDLRLADAAKVHLFLESHLDDARASLATFADLPEAERSPSVLTLFPAFSNLYRLDQRQRVERVYKAAANSKVFTGFSFTGGKLGDYLRSGRHDSHYSEIMRGHEDDAPSVYFALQRGDQQYLGRLNLDYVQHFLTQFSRFSGTPVMLVAKDGFVMLTSDPELQIPAFDLHKWAGPPAASRTLSAGKRDWIPIISATSAIGACIVTLIPTELLATQRTALLLFASVFTGVLVLLASLKNRRLKRLLVEPMASFIRKMRDLEQGRLSPADDADNYRFAELADIHTRFMAMAEAIRQREQSLRESEQRAEEANRAKSTFLANMSHEIRTPMNAILGFAQVLARDPELGTTQRKRLTTIQHSGEHLLTLINDILDMAKIEAGRMTPQMISFDLGRLLTETGSYFEERARERGLALTVHAEGLPHSVEGDELKLRQVLINLIGNAVKFTTAGAVTLRVEAVGGEQVLFSVIDTGPGIAPGDRTRVFEPFAQTEAGRRVQGGTGLGLALSRQFVRLMGGELTLDSTPGQGSCFSFALRLRPVDATVTTTLPATPPSEVLEPDQPVCRILIVDDLVDNREPLRALLNGLNPHPPVLEFREAADGREAVAVWEEWQPHVIFMDMRMPVMSGEEATRQIKARQQSRPHAVQSVVVALTASAFDENRVRFLACGCDEFARKPFQAAELFGILARYAGLRFVHAGEPPAPVATLSPAEAAAHLTACPAGWRAELQGAVALGDFDRISTLLEWLQDADPALAETLGAWAYNYDLDAFSRVLTGTGPE